MDIQFWLRKNQNGSKGTIYCHIVVDGHRTKTSFSTHIKIEARHWMPEQGYVKKSARLAAVQLEAIRQEITEAYLRLKMADPHVTAEAVKEKYLTGNEPVVTFSTFAQEVAQKRGEAKRTAETNLNYLNNIRLYLEETKRELIGLPDVGTDLLAGFEEWAKQQRQFSHNYTAKHLQFLKLVMKQAHLKGIIKNNKVQYYPVNMKKPSEPVFLIESELKILHDTPMIEGLRKVTDCFLFQCYTGFSYYCLNSFDFEKHTFQRPDGTRWIKKTRKKSNETAVLPVFPEVAALLEKYDGKLPVMSNQVLNRYLKQVMVITGIEKHLTTHIGRKTFATRLLNKGVSIESVSRMLGHANTRITQSTYARLLPDRIEKEVNEMMGG